jgi:hypothetical protein
VRIAMNNDAHLKAKVVIACSDLQQFIREKDLSPGQLVSILSACITSIMQEKNPSHLLEETEAFY